MSCQAVETQRLGCGENVKFSTSINLLRVGTCENYPNIPVDVSRLNRLDDFVEVLKFNKKHVDFTKLK